MKTAKIVLCCRRQSGLHVLKITEMLDYSVTDFADNSASQLSTRCLTFVY